MTWLAGADPASLRGGHRADQARQRFEDALTQITGSVLEAGLTLQTALDLPAGALRQAGHEFLNDHEGAGDKAPVLFGVL